MSKKIVVINAGSSSIKWTLFEKDTLQEIASGLAERIGVDGALDIKFNGEKHEVVTSLPNHKVAVDQILNLWKKHHVINSFEDIANIGFRVVHGGTYFSSTTLITPDSLSKIEECSKYAPLHNPGAVQAIKAFNELIPNVVKTASFDTAFHTTIPNVNAYYPINLDVAKKYGVKKYGFHGISHRFITLKLAEILKKEKVSFVNLHIGNGSSLCAVKDSLSFDTSMGLTPLAGVMMGTRSGDIDPSIIEFLVDASGQDVHQVTNILIKQSGLLGVSGFSSDMRDVLKAASEGHENAQLSIDLYVQRLVDTASQYANKIGGAEAFVFTAGIGENAKIIRQKVVEGLASLGVKISQERNEQSYGSYALISADDSSIPVYVIRTNEELMIAQDAKEL